MQVLHLAKKHGIKPKEMVSLIKDLGFTIGNHMSKVSDEMEKAVMLKLDSQTEEIEKNAGIPIDKPAPEKEPAKTIPDNGDGEPDEVIFFSTSRNHNIAYKKEEYFGASAKIRTPARSIQFEEFGYRTSDPEVIDFIKAQRSFTVRSKDYPQGKVRIVTEAELARLRYARMPRMTTAKATDDRPTSDVDMSQLNPVPDVI